MELFDAIKTRKTVRKYTDELIQLDDVKKIIDAGRIAPCATNSQMWHFIAVLNKDIREQLRTCVEDFYNEMERWPESEPYKDKVSYFKHFSTSFADAPLNIIIIQKPKDSAIGEILKQRGIIGEDFYKFRPDSALLSIGAAIENMTLAAHDLGYGSCWLCAPLVAHQKMKEILNIDNEDKIVSILSVGKPKNPNQPFVQKKSLEEVLTIIE